MADYLNIVSRKKSDRLCKRFKMARYCVRKRKNIRNVSILYTLNGVKHGAWLFLHYIQ